MRFVRGRLWRSIAGLRGFLRYPSFGKTYNPSYIRPFQTIEQVCLGRNGSGVSSRLDRCKNRCCDHTWSAPFCQLDFLERSRIRGLPVLACRRGGTKYREFFAGLLRNALVSDGQIYSPRGWPLVNRPAVGTICPDDAWVVMSFGCGVLFLAP